MEIKTTEQEFYDRYWKRLLHNARAIHRIRMEWMNSPYVFDPDAFEDLDQVEYDIKQLGYHLHNAMGWNEAFPDLGPKKEKGQDYGTFPDDTCPLPF